MTASLRTISLFTGIGGLDLGIERAGMHVVAHSEIDPYASRVLAKHWPHAPNLGDITTMHAELDEQGGVRMFTSNGPVTEAGAHGIVYELGPIDVLVGGFPCQDLSLAGLGAGMGRGWVRYPTRKTRTRSGLWFEQFRIIRSIRPRYVIVENVAALLARGLHQVLGDLASIGYDAWWDCIPAASVGAPHRRDRLFIVATRADVASFDTDTTPMHWATQLGSEPHGDHGSVVADADGQRRDTRRAHDATRQSEPTGSSAAPAHSDRERGNEVHPDDARRAGRARPGQGRGHRGTGDAPADTHSERVRVESVAVRRRGGASVTERPREAAADTHDAGRVEQRRAFPCERGSWWLAEPGVGRVAAGIPNRVDRLRCLGNAVVPQVAEFIGTMVVEHHRNEMLRKAVA